MLTWDRVDLETGVARYEAIADSAVVVQVLVSGSDHSHGSSTGEVLFHAELVGLLREDGVVVVGVQHGHGDESGGGGGGGAVVGGGHPEGVAVPGLAVQGLSQVHPAAVGEDAEDVGAGEQAVGEAGVVAGVQVYSRHLHNLLDTEERVSGDKDQPWDVWVKSNLLLSLLVFQMCDKSNSLFKQS